MNGLQFHVHDRVGLVDLNAVLFNVVVQEEKRTNCNAVIGVTGWGRGSALNTSKERKDPWGYISR
jgi:hypothetical protein